MSWLAKIAPMILIGCSASACFSQPVMSVASSGISGTGNRVWQVEIATPTDGSVATQLRFDVTGGSLVSYEVSTSDWDRSNPIASLTLVGDGDNPANRGVQTSPALAGLAQSSLSPAGLIAGLIGDFNLDGVVGDADYTVWRDSFDGLFTQLPLNPQPPGIGLLPGDGDQDGDVDDDDYTLWLLNYGATVVAASTASSQPVTNGDSSLLVALGSRVLDAGSPVTLLTFETQGVGPTSVTWSGALSHNQVFYPTYSGTLAVPEPHAALLLVGLAGGNLRRRRSAR